MNIPRRPAIALLVLGAVLLIGVPALWLATRPASSVGDIAVIEDALRSDAAEFPLRAPSSTTEAPPPSTGPTDPATRPTPTLAPELTEPPPPQPIGLRIDVLEVKAPIGAYGVDDRGRMDVPDNTTEVGWYRYGPVPGSNGSAVLAAHVDLARQGPGVFYDLDTLDVGDQVLVDYADGTTQAFAVVGRAVYQKSDLPLDVIFSREGPPVLTLVTCGGDFSRSSGSYDSNVVVYAVPTELPGGAAT